ncbi:hypothetical protein [Brevibacterium jeotgali]|uniref:Uncharacterized protein n=1 Tax=Brevibacterium jeotgali TaxID=1262550 RepID=A0A2H1L326_9MICO|nr:hypothetical protein [Brevibacterium jeotgali]TWC02496.1 hypothetical protein FB108_1174 [Brevibacterium jeotgali]SMY11288.1 hypothetical protein BJEO58_00873 [Brevibacterium jeotgali]
MSDVQETSAGAETPAAQVDPTFDLLDRPVALEGADDIILSAPAPDTPTVDGRRVEDPRLIEALSVPQEFTRADVLDRVAKLGGVLRVLGGDGASKLLVSSDVPEPARTFAVLAGVRIGLVVELPVAAADGASSVTRPVVDAETLTIRAHRDGEETAEESPHAFKTAVRTVRSHFEGVAVEGGGQARDLDRLARDSRIVPAPSRRRDGSRRALVIDGEDVLLADVAQHLQGLLRTNGADGL